MDISELKRWCESELRNIYEAGEARNIFRLMVEEYLGSSPSALLAHQEVEVNQESIEQFKEALDSLKANVPVQYILGKVYFMDCEIKVGPGVLIPRPETEELVLMIVNDLWGVAGKKLVLDIGTGTACIPVALYKHLANIELTGIDISGNALRYARDNISANKAAVKLLQLDFLDESQWNTLPSYDIIVSNPPYVTGEDARDMGRNVLDHEPREALFVDDSDPLVFYEGIIRFSREHMNEEGWLYLEINEHYGNDLLERFKNEGFSEPLLIKDFKGKDRFIKVRKVTL